MDQVKQKIKDKLLSATKSPNKKQILEYFKKHQAIFFKKGSIISNEGQPLERIFIIKKGFIKLYSLSDEGKESIIYLLGPGYVLGARAFLEIDERAIHNAEAITEVEVITVSHKEYLELITENPDYLVDLLQVFINRLIYTENKLKGFITGDATSRIANFLFDIYERYSDKENEKMILSLPLTHQRIGEFVGAIRETVTVSLNELQKQNIIKDEKGIIEILDLEKLRGYIK